MFIKAIEIASKFIRPIHTIARNYNSTIVLPGAASLFFINSDGWALTCRHVAENFINAEKVGKKFREYKTELAEITNSTNKTLLKHKLVQKYGYKPDTTCEILNRFINCVEGDLHVNIIVHKIYDVALLKFERFSKLLCDSFPVFPKETDRLAQGKYLCRMGFPFPEFNNFSYYPSNDRIDWTDQGRTSSPSFPIEGMLTRHLSVDNQIMGFEMSTPGLRGQSGGPAFDVDGVVWGMQFATNHLDLNFDVNQVVIRNGNKKHISDSAFLHTGHCINADVLKLFMRENKVQFQEI